MDNLNIKEIFYEPKKKTASKLIKIAREAKTDIEKKQYFSEQHIDLKKEELKFIEQKHRQA